MINFTEVLKGDFEDEKRLDISSFTKNECFVTLLKIPIHIRQRIYSMIGKKINTQYNNDGALSSQTVEYTEDYHKAMEDSWRQLFKYGVDPLKHGFLDSKTGKPTNISLSDWEELGRIAQPLIKYIEIEALRFNGLFFDNTEEDDKKK